MSGYMALETCLFIFLLTHYSKGFRITLMMQATQKEQATSLKTNLLNNHVEYKLDFRNDFLTDFL